MTTTIHGNVNANRDFIGRDQNNHYTVVVLPENGEPTEDLGSACLELKERYEPETLLIPAGSFTMGSSSEAHDSMPNETPAHKVHLEAYRIGRYPVTNVQYAAYIQMTGQVAPPELGWDGQRVPAGTEMYPVTGVSWREALTYCTWLSQQVNRPYALPNEAQWEKAARGIEGYQWPWGNSWEDDRCNHGDRLMPVTAFPPQNSYDCCDMVGNAREWTCSLWGENIRQPDERFGYPWQADERNDPLANAIIRRIWRGGGYDDKRLMLRCPARQNLLPSSRGTPGKRMGFRVVISE